MSFNMSFKKLFNLIRRVFKSTTIPSGAVKMDDTIRFSLPGNPSVGIRIGNLNSKSNIEITAGNIDYLSFGDFHPIYRIEEDGERVKVIPSINGKEDYVHSSIIRSESRLESLSCLIPKPMDVVKSYHMTRAQGILMLFGHYLQLLKV